MKRIAWANAAYCALKMYTFRNCLIAALALLVCTVAIDVRAQSPTPLSNPNLQLHHAGYVIASKVLVDGSVIVAGTFTSFNGVPRSGLAKFLPGGGLDPAWTPTVGGPSFDAQAIAVDASGSIYIAGSFSSVNGVARANIAKLNADGSLDMTWNPSTNGFGPSALALDGTGNLFAGGSFTSIGGQTLTNLAKLSTSGTGAADPSWNPAPDANVAALSYAGGSLFVGGSFANIGGAARPCIAKLSTSGAGVADATWNPAPAAASGPQVYALLPDGSGNLYVGGAFATIGGQTRSGIARLSTVGSGAADANWNPSISGTYASVTSLALDGSNHLYVGGYFTTIGSQSLTNIARVFVTGPGVADASWNPAPDFYVYSIAVGQTGNVYVGGTFNNVGGVRHLGFAQIDTSGVVSASMPDAESRGEVYALANLPDGSMIVGGYFLKAGQQTRKNILRLQADGTLDPNWDAPADQYIQSLALDGVGNVYVGGIFSNIGAQPRAGIAKLSATGAGIVDASWDPSAQPANSLVYALVVDGNQVYAGGQFTSIGGHAFNGGLARLSASGAGAADVSWIPFATDPVNDGGYVYTLALDGGGYLYAGGIFAEGAGGNLYYMARYSVAGNGSPDPNWNPAPDNQVQGLALDGSGSLFVGGTFAHMGALARSNIAKVSATGTGAVDATWNPSADGRVYNLLSDGAGSLYASGRFTHIGGSARNYIAKLSMTGTGAANTGWNSSADNYVRVLTRASGKIYSGGDFTSIGNASRNGLAAFAQDAVFSTGFDVP